LVVVDIGTGLHEANRRVLLTADEIIVCLEAERVSVNLAQAILAELKHSGISPERIRLVLVQRSPASVVSVSAIENALQHKIAQLLSAAAELADEAVDRGMPMITADPDSLTASQFRDLAHSLSVGKRQELPRSPNGTGPR
jgi:Flp pilus assembly CpaE family ATPase